VVIVLDIGPKVRRFIPGRGRWILWAMKIRSTISFGGEEKLSAARFYGLLKIPAKYDTEILRRKN
jgi:hypothetical protein